MARCITIAMASRANGCCSKSKAQLSACLACSNRWRSRGDNHRTDVHRSPHHHPIREDHRMKLEGGCYCKDLRYVAEGDPVMKGQCHCRECQYITGGSPNV